MFEIVKKFREWLEVKVRLHFTYEEPVYFREGEIWWCSLGMNIGHEQNGKHQHFERPVLVFKKFNKHMLWILPLTTRPKKFKYHYCFTYAGVKYAVVLSQIRTISSKRLLRKIRLFPKEHFSAVQERLITIIKTNAPARGAFVNDSFPRGEDLGADARR